MPDVAGVLVISRLLELYPLTFDCAKHSHFQTPLENPSVQTRLVLLCCHKRLAIQMHYNYYYGADEGNCSVTVFTLLVV